MATVLVGIGNSTLNWLLAELINILLLGLVAVSVMEDEDEINGASR